MTEFGTHRIGNDLQTWEYPAPAGWVAYRVPGDIPTPVDRVDDWDELRWRPLGEPTEGGYSIRVKAIDNHRAPEDEVRVKMADFELLYDDVVVLEQTDDSVAFTFRTEDDLFRVNFFQWFTAPDSSEATLEIVGRGPPGGSARDARALRAVRRAGAGGRGLSLRGHWSPPTPARRSPCPGWRCGPAPRAAGWRRPAPPARR